jgi:hypothetical protein
MPAIMPATLPARPSTSLLVLALLAACGDAPGTTTDTGDTTADAGTTTGGSTPTTSDTGDTPGTTDTGDPTTTTGSTTTGEPLPPADIPAGCNPIAYESDCLLPYPSDWFLVPDAALPNGVRVELGAAATPTTMTGAPVDLLADHPADGFSHHMPILALFPGGIDTAGLTFHQDDAAATLDPGSPTVLLDVESGELVPHWVELDAMADDPARQALIVRPYVRLADSRRYVVAFQGLVAADGTAVAPPLGFAHLRAGDVAGHPVLEPLAARYEQDIFAPLAAAGIPRAGLQLAWDFTTASEQRNTADMLAIRDDLLAWFDQGGPPLMIDEVLPDFSAEMALRVEGRIEVPLYLEEDEPMALLHRGPDGAVTPNGVHWVPFTLQVPKSAWPADADFEPLRLIQFGHGFFGEREEINWSAMRAFSSERRVAMIATEWAGMALEDQGAVVETIAVDPSRVFLFTDRLHQGFANQLALSHAIRTTLAASDAVTAFDKPLYDPDQSYWYGISQGSIFGACIMALSPHLEKAVLDVGGGPYSLMMTRSGSFSDLFEIMKVTIGDDPLTIQKFIALSQHVWDRVDPITYAPHVLQDPYQDSPPRALLFSYGIGDHSVTNVASHLLLRALGVDLLDPAAEPVYGLGGVPAPTDGSAGVVVDFMYPDPAGVEAELPDDPPDEENVHEGVRRNPKIKDMIDAFLRPGGEIENFCDGPCDPE